MSPSQTSAAIASLNEIATLRIELEDSEPLIWREVEVPTSITLKVLHDIIQATIGWGDYHLWEFAIGEQRYGLRDADDDFGGLPPKQATRVKLRDVLEPQTTIIDYIYDFGDGSEHRVIASDVRAGDPALAYPRYIGGEGAGPPEDCGGLPGFYELLAARENTDDPRHAEAVEYLDGFDPNVIDDLVIRDVLAPLAARQNAAQARITGKT